MSDASGTTDVPAPPLRWLALAAVVLFGASPSLMLGLVLWLVPEPESEGAEKVRVMAARPPADTLVVGDSRVLRLDEEAFTRRGWRYFNMGMSGLSPSDVAAQLGLALERLPVARVVMGVSFEQLTGNRPGEFATHAVRPPFGDVDLAPFGIDRSQLAPTPVTNSRRATARLRALIGGPNPLFLPNGNYAYTRVRADIAAGRFDREFQLSPFHYFNRDDGEVRYQETRRLSPFDREQFAGMLECLRRRKIPCLVFETARTQAYQQLIDQTPPLPALQEEFRAWLRAESRGSVRFLPCAATRALHDEADFFDAVHFIGKTENRLAERLAQELASLESEVRR